jgi:serine/threonine protein phosphatase PrpC
MPVVPDVEILYIVATVVAAALFVWVVAVWIVAPNAEDVTKAKPSARGQPAGNPAKPEDDDKTAPGKAALRAIATLEPARPPAAALGATGAVGNPLGRMGPGSSPVISDAPLVVTLPTMRQRLDSHQEIHDSAPGATVIVMEDDEGPPSPNPLVLVSAAGSTDASNASGEGTHAVVHRHHLFVLADDVGKDRGRQVASKLAVQEIASAFDTEASVAIAEDPMIPRRANRLRRAVLLANRGVYREAHASASAGVQAMVATLYFSPNNQRAYVVVVGDGRCYRMRASEMKRVGREPRPDAARTLGAKENIEVVVTAESPEAKDLYLLCSGVLTRVLTEEEIKDTVRGGSDLEAAVKKLVARAHRNAPTEAMTAILVRVDAPPA